VRHKRRQQPLQTFLAAIITQSLKAQAISPVHIFSESRRSCAIYVYTTEFRILISSTLQQHLRNGSLSGSLPVGYAVRLRWRILHGRHRRLTLARHQRLSKLTLRRTTDRHDNSNKSKSTCDGRQLWSMGWHGKPQYTKVATKLSMDTVQHI
jgi:hypothetical protein